MYYYSEQDGERYEQNVFEEKTEKSKIFNEIHTNTKKRTESCAQILAGLLKIHLFTHKYLFRTY